MKITLTKEDIDLIGKDLITHRWKIEDTEGQNNEFDHCASLADRLAYNHNGGVLTLNSPNEE
ncbi:hypothetical protein [Acidithiobacillus ferriphilus]|uniref:hypothetical protein n=1 Tax=Acidithiobacillus ferriphilus TaxID=1689834 RepID=UPI00232E888F|nr:hypothetical protein [Acidithiobacillus ferriphilus]WCE94250.1 hypothetical protein PJU76_01520 [Acidithiobacillus ferriphilus]